LLSSKHLNYLKWREAYKLVIERKHLELTGIEKIKSIKNTMNRKSTETFDLINLRAKKDKKDK